MSDNKDNLDTQSKITADSKDHKQPITVSKESVVEVAKKRSAKDVYCG